MESFAPLAALLTAAVVVVAAPLVVALVLGITRVFDLRFDRVLAVAVVAPPVVAGGALLALVGGGAALLVASIVLALGALPVAVGWVIVDRYAPLPSAVARRRVGLAWPAVLVVAGLLFVAPGGFSRYNVLFLDSPAREAVVGVLFLLVIVGPGALVAALARRSNRTRKRVQS